MTWTASAPQTGSCMASIHSTTGKYISELNHQTSQRDQYQIRQESEASHFPIQM